MPKRVPHLRKPLLQCEARVEHDRSSDRLGIIRKDRNLNWPTIVQNLEVASPQVWDQTTLAVAHRGIYGHGVCSRAEGCLLRGKCRDEDYREHHNCVLHAFQAVSTGVITRIASGRNRLIQRDAVFEAAKSFSTIPDNN